MKNILKKILSLLSRSQAIYLFSKKIIDYAKNENNCETDTNGELYFIKKISPEMRTVFDVGANIGEWTALITEICPNAIVYSFEPSKKTFETLSKNISNPNAHLHNIGLGDKKEARDFFIYGENSVLNSAIERDLFGPAHAPTTERVSFNTVDDFCKENNVSHISFLKIDTEGNELAVLYGATRFITEGKIDAIQFEYGGTYIDAGILLKDVFAFFQNKPYSIYKLMQGNLKPTPGYSQDMENFQYSNYIALLRK